MGKGNKMIVFYKNANVLNLPYKVTNIVELRDEKNVPVYDSNGKIKLVEKDAYKYFRFIPGKNIITEELWKNISECNKDDMDHYSTILSVFRPKQNDDIDMEIGENEEDIDLSKLSTREFRELIENTMELNEINKYFDYEKSRDKVRPSVIKTIRLMKTKISKADQAIESHKKG